MTFHSVRARRRTLRILLVAVSVTLLAALLPGVAGAELRELPDATWMPDGRVNAILRIGSTIYLGGDFASLRSPDGEEQVPRHNLAALDVATGRPRTWAPSVSFLDPDNPDAGGTPEEAVVYALAAAEDGSRIFVGGHFKSINGTRRLRLAAVSPVSGAVQQSWGAQAAWDVRALAVSGDRLYVGGSFNRLFTASSSLLRANLGAVAVSTGQILDWSPGTNGLVRALKTAEGGTRVIVGGEFEEIGGQSRYRIAMVHADGSVDAAFAPTAADFSSECAIHKCAVADVDVDGARVYAAGAIDDAIPDDDQDPGGRLIVYDVAGGEPMWTASTNGDVQAVDVHDGRAYVGGHFERWEGQLRPRFVTVDVTTRELVADFQPLLKSPPPNLGVWAVLAEDGRLFLGGDFTDVMDRNGVDSGQAKFAQFSDPNAPQPEPSPTTSPSPTPSPTTSPSPTPSPTTSPSPSPTTSPSPTASPSPSPTDGGGSGQQPDEPEPGSVTRVAGEDRIGTAVAVSRSAWQRAQHAVLATAVDHADALAGTPLAARLGAPLLLTLPGALPEAVAAELQRLEVEEVWILGGPRAVSAEVEAQLRAAGLQTHRVAGDDRYATAAAAAARAAGGPRAEVVLASGERFADAVSAGALAGLTVAPPTLLTGSRRLPPATAQALRDLGAAQILLLGGPAAVSEDVEAELVAAGHTVRRLYGATRYETSMAVSEEALRRAGLSVPVVFATGENYPDALASGALGARIGAVLLLVPRRDLGDAPGLADYVRENREALRHGVVVGGPAAVSDAALAQLREAMARS